MKAAVLAVAALVLTGCGGRSTSSSGDAPRVGTVALTISISAGKQDRLTKEWTLTCPDEGTLPNAERACKRLDAMGKPFATVPKSAACTEVYGGPQVAEVRGRFRGRGVSAHFSRTNGCEIARWDRVRFLFPDA